MRFQLSTKIPNTINLAFSGGIDSLVVAHWLKYKRYNQNVTLLHFNHGCQYSDDIEMQCRNKASELNLPIIVGKIDELPTKGQSLEDFWRRKRYKFLRSFENKFITAHHLDDAVETWISSALHGNPKLIPIKDEKLIRPFLMVTKEQFMKYGKQNNLIAVDDPYNREYHLQRNYIRANLIEHCKVVSPGLNTIIRKKYLEIIKNEN